VLLIQRRGMPSENQRAACLLDARQSNYTPQAARNYPLRQARDKMGSNIEETQIQNAPR
jgi:hypothetical protein